ADAWARRPRRLGPRPSTGGPLERPADGRRVRRDRANRRARAADRAHRQSCLARLHGPEAPVAADARAGDLRAYRTYLPTEGLRALAAHRLVGDRRSRRVRDVATRSGDTQLERVGSHR